MKKNNSHKTSKDSFTVKTEVVCPNDTNPMGMLQGGRLVEWMDIAAAVCAQMHAGKICVTASINHVDFTAAAKVGNIVTITANITRAFTSSMEIFVQANARDVISGDKHSISEAYFSFVAIDTSGEAATVPGFKAVTTKEKEQFSGALIRRKQRAKLKINTSRK